MSSFRDGIVLLGTIAGGMLSAITTASVLGATVAAILGAITATIGDVLGAITATIAAVLGAITVAILFRLLASRGHTAVSMATSCQSGGVTDTGSVILV
jgi:hypothetical protein